MYNFILLKEETIEHPTKGLITKLLRQDPQKKFYEYWVNANYSITPSGGFFGKGFDEYDKAMEFYEGIGKV